MAVHKWLSARGSKPLRIVAALGCLTVVLGGMGVALSSPVLAADPLSHDPVPWHEHDRAPIEEPKERDPSLVMDMVDDGFWLPLGRMLHPGRTLRHLGSLFGGDHVRPAQNINALDEALNSTWFQNRMGLFPMSPAEAARGPGVGTGPDRSGPWTIVSAKTEGATPGFVVRDSRGSGYLIKFDGPGYLHMASAAAVISNRILHAAGYNVPDDAVVTFRRQDLVLGEDVRITEAGGRKRAMVEQDVEDILDRLDRLPGGEFLAISSKFLSGVPVGPFDYRGKRKDDPNDRIRHENRRELRGLKIVAAWINHWDTKQHNSLDMYVTEGERSFVKHYLIDFASTLGSSATDAAQREGFEYTVDPPAVLGRMLTLGLYESPWRKVQRPQGLDEVSYFESEQFHPSRFEPMQPNTAFANLTDRDGYWAAKIISAFTDAHLEAIVAQGKYANPEAATYVARILGERRDKIARHFFDRIAPLDFFRVESGAIAFQDLGVERGIYAGPPSRYRARLARAHRDRSTNAFTPWIELVKPRVPFQDGTVSFATGDGFAAVECQVNRGEGWSKSVTAYVSLQGNHVVAVER